MDKGYAEMLGLAFETYSNFGACEQRFSPISKT